MNAHRMEATVTEDRTPLLDNLPFGAGQIVEVIMLASDDNLPAVVVANEPKMASRLNREAWSDASRKALQEIWDNPEDAAYACCSR